MPARIIRTVGTSAANTAQTVSTAPETGAPMQVIMVTAKYSAAPTHAGVTVTLNSGAGAGYDAQLDASASNAQTYVYRPSPPVPMYPDDAIDVVAPAGGAGITSSVTIYTRPI